ncbi:NAD-binding protein [Georgenia sp. 10Sc9-8]|uniref:NAD-binding protein n=1 Tax=Georgenia halotolerans TaxID=3028317 RepID=A0ABT5U530_9MICO|nr:NAD-binding protein [Georgenia halotolerans]
MKGSFRRHVWHLWDNHGWLVLSCAVVLVTAAGFVGFSSYDRDGSWSVATRLYLALQLFTLESGGLEGPVPPVLDLARWAAPLTTATAAVGTAVAVVRRRSAGWRARTLTGHLIVVGLGDRGWLLTQRAVADRTDVAAIEIDGDNPHVASARRLGVPVIVGDAAERDRLLSAGLRRADRLVCLTGSSRTGALVAQAVLSLQRDLGAGTEERLSTFVEVPDITAVRELSALVTHDGYARRQEFFSLEDRAGAVILDRFDPPRAPGARPPPLVVVGDSDAALSVVAAAARRWEAIRRDVRTATGRQELCLLVPAADEVTATWSRAGLLHPDLAPDRTRHGPASTLDVAALDPWHPRADLAERLQRLPGTPAVVVVASTDEAFQLRCVSALTDLLAGTGTTVVVVIPRGGGLLSLVASPSAGEDGATAAPVVVFAVDQELCSDALIRRGRTESMARALHEGYLRHLAEQARPEQSAANPAYVSWDALSEGLRRQNIEAAQAMWDMLAAEGYVVVPRTGPLLVLPAESVERIAAEEHRRWFAAKYPHLPPPDWDQVDPVHQEQSRDQARRIPATLAVAGLQVAPARRAEPVPAGLQPALPEEHT